MFALQIAATRGFADETVAFVIRATNKLRGSSSFLFLESDDNLAHSTRAGRAAPESDAKATRTGLLHSPRRTTASCKLQNNGKRAARVRYMLWEANGTHSNPRLVFPHIQSFIPLPCWCASANGSLRTLLRQLINQTRSKVQGEEASLLLRRDQLVCTTFFNCGNA